ncbi:MAG: hypothetical protein JO283_14790 [Bradyrhizobium sp.]|nr:hypothetical protein [Bradyrhizobium sp.]
MRDHVYPIIGHQPITTLNNDMICEVLDRPGSGTDARTFWVRLPIVADMVPRLLADIVNFASEPLKRDLIDSALCHKFESETQEAYNRCLFWKSAAR